ncbi:MAG: ribosomal RNA small subunit methyltransferase A [Desulfobacterales bacterium]|nr:ribosomal RNA small subunit methyltransferase A [Desulfobacterales bacterium]
MTFPAQLLRKNNIFPKKDFGQNFLIDDQTAQMIIKRAGIDKDDIVLEIGSGLGALTVQASKKAKKVYGIEKDDRLIDLLKEEVVKSGQSNIEIICKDIMKLNIEEFAQTQRKKLVIIGNLPYNISSQILFRLVENREFIKRAYLMFQLELANRITAFPGSKDYSRLSAVMQYCSTVKPIADIKPHLFFPKPAVQSRVIEVSFFDTPAFSYEKEKFLFKVIKAAFSKRRKTLKNSLAGDDLLINREEAEKILKTAKIDPVRRGETVNVEEFVNLAKEAWNSTREDKW